MKQPGLKSHSKSEEIEHCTCLAGSPGFDILALFSVAKDIYGKLNYDDVDCQKKLICEFMENPDMFGRYKMSFVAFQ